MRTVILACLTLILIAGCGLMPGGKSRAPAKIFLLDSHFDGVVRASQKSCRIVSVVPPEPAPGYSGAQMLYSRQANQIERFAFARWAESPAAMLEPLLLNALRATEAYTAVLATPASISADLRIETDGLRLVQIIDGQSSRVVLHLEARVFAPRERRLLATETFHYTKDATAATSTAGVTAANQAVNELLRDFSRFVVTAGEALTQPCVAGV